ncbi:hypothetical protein PVAP13_3NG258010 [Panicum virgatum]|uniref:Uncharacterized protein n=1 Tax=Panicum virgatum TaxID=38727 RepID=A0A8T0U9Y8_PANVG|nr:hypothetical protein PVAP13_3NG258010 [Panicum virgatum]
MSSVSFTANSARASQSSKYSARPCQLRAPLMSDTQESSIIASLTVLDFLNLGGTTLKTLGARFSILQPCNQRSVQNKVFLPLPTVVTTDTANIAAVLGYVGTSRPAHGRSGLVFSNQSHRICNAQPIISRLWIPSPPRSRGLMTFSHATKQLPPLISFLPFHKKLLLILSTARMNHLGTLIAISRYIGMAVRTNLTNTARPAKLIREAFQPGSLLAIFSIQVIKSLRRNFLSEIGNPK